jgi:hypothetical protein
MASFPSADNTDYIRALLELCLNQSATCKDFCDVLWFSDANECSEMFERKFGITPYNYSFTRRRTHIRDHTNQIFDFIKNPATTIDEALYWIAMTIFIIRDNISDGTKVNQGIDELFYNSVYMPLINNLDTLNLQDHDKIKEVLCENIPALQPVVIQLSQWLPFTDNFLRTVSSNDYTSPFAWH